MSDEGTQPPATPLVAAIEKRKRTLHTFNAGDLLGHDVGVGALAVRIPTIAEENDALVSAATFASNYVGESTAVSSSLNTNFETLCVLSSSFRDAKDPQGVPAFGPAQWMADKLTAPDVERLLGALAECRARESKLRGTLSEDDLLALAETIAEVEPDEAAGVLVPHSRVELVDMVYRLSNMLVSLLDDMRSRAMAAATEGDHAD